MMLKKSRAEALTELTSLLQDGYRVLEILQGPAEKLPDSGLLQNEVEVWRTKVRNALKQSFPTSAEAEAFKNLPPRQPPYNWTYLRGHEKAAYTHLGRLDGLQTIIREDLVRYTDPGEGRAYSPSGQPEYAGEVAVGPASEGAARRTVCASEPGEVRLDQPLNAPRALISYAWEGDEHKGWVRDFATRLRGNGVETILDQWHAVPGDQLPEFMERGIRDNDYVLIICTPNYKKRSDNRTGGVGYEGDIISAEVFATRNHRKFIPLLRRGEWREAAPSGLSGKIYLDLRGEPYSEEQYLELLATLHGQREVPPPLGLNPLLGSSTPPT